MSTPSPPEAVQFQHYAAFTSVDPAANRQRFYCLSWQPTLFGGGALVKTWGRLGTEGRSRTLFWGARPDAQALVERLVRQRFQHGYQLQTWV
jgi:predicted DNA-binding WGR domain protein